MPATPATTPAAPTPAIVKGAVTPVEALTAVMAKLDTVRATDLRTSLTIYREHAHAIAGGRLLKPAEVEAINHAIKELKLTPNDLKTDVNGIIAQANQIKAIAAGQRLVAELELQLPAWTEEEKTIRARLAEIERLRARYLATANMTGGAEAEKRRLVGEFPRVLAEFTAAENFLKTPPCPYVPKVISNSNEAATHQGNVPGMQQSAFGLNLGTFGASPGS